MFAPGESRAVVTSFDEFMREVREPRLTAVNLTGQPGLVRKPIAGTATEPGRVCLTCPACPSLVLGETWNLARTRLWRHMDHFCARGRLETGPESA